MGFDRSVHAIVTSSDLYICCPLHFGGSMPCTVDHLRQVYSDGLPSVPWGVRPPGDIYVCGEDLFGDCQSLLKKWLFFSFTFGLEDTNVISNFIVHWLKNRHTVWLRVVSAKSDRLRTQRWQYWVLRWRCWVLSVEFQCFVSQPSLILQHSKDSNMKREACRRGWHLNRLALRNKLICCAQPNSKLFIYWSSLGRS